jgi:hypothetical protein
MIASLQHEIGSLIQERYEVMSVLGSGAFGTVYRCRDRELGNRSRHQRAACLDDPQTHRK